ncbi:MAG: sodium/proton-translocating pyrophosphatase [Armatimonadetes bacterium]|nr:sodium/proton-translocating pyrophosphatase [Armatimonadota bacterium]
MMGGTGAKINTIKLRGTNEDQIERIEKLIQARDSFASSNGKKAWEVSAKDIANAPELANLKFEDMNPMTGQKMDKTQAIDQMLERLGSISSKDVDRAKPEPLEGFSSVSTVDLKTKQISFTSSSFVQPDGKTPSANETIDLASAVEGKKLDLALVEIKLTTPASNGVPASTKSTWNGPVSLAFAKKRVAEIEEQQKAQAKGQPMTKVEMGKTINLDLMVDKRGKLVAAVEDKDLPQDFDFSGVNSQPVVSAPSYFPINAEEYGKISKQIEDLSKKGSLEGAPKLPPPAQITLVKLSRTEVPWYLFFIAITFGLFLAFVIEILTDYFVSTHKKPTREVAGVSTAGPAPMIIQGFAYASESSVYMVFAIVLALLVPLFLFNPATYGSLILSFYGIALVGLGLLTTTGYVLAMDTFGPISDNAQGVYEMSGEGHDNVQGSKAVQRLDAAGNTTKALTKGFAIATAVVAAVALFHSYIEDAQLTGRGLPLDMPEIFLGFLVGGAAPYLFSAFSINAVGRASFQLINEVRRQFRNDPGILAGTSKPNYASCVAIVTAAAQKELLGPGILAIALPVAVAFGFAIGKPVTYVDGNAYCLVGAQALGGFLAGAILSGQLMAVLLANSGGMWDNAKKLIEDGLYGGKGTDAHKAAVVCDTVGDPFKDTAGPALNPLIKVMNLVALLLAPVIIRPFGNTTLIIVTVLAISALGFAIYLSKKGSLADEMMKVTEEAAEAEKAQASSGKKKITVDED